MTPLPITYAEVGTILDHCIGEGRKSVLFASPEPGSGTSTVAYAVAQRAAASGRRTVLADFNTHSSFTRNGLALNPTVWDLGEGLAPEAVLEFEDTNLAILPAPVQGGFGVRHRDLESVRATVRQLTERFDFIVGDAPCLTRPNRSGLPTTLAATAFDCCVMVLLSGKSLTTVVDSAVRQLQDHDVCLSGVVMVDRDMPPLRAELVRQARKFSRFMPGFPGWLDRRLAGLKLLKSEY